MRKRAKGGDWGQVKLVSCPNFTILCLIKWFIFSTQPLYWRQYGVWSCQSMPKWWLISCTTFEIKCGPLSEDMVVGTPKRGIISSNNILTTSQDLAVLVGNASGQPEKVSVNTNINTPPFLGSSVKSICHCFPGPLPFPIWPISGLGLLLGLVWRQRSHCRVTCFTISSYNISNQVFI